MLQPGDAVKKWAILIPTRPLPRAWRVAARERLLAKLEVGKAERARMLIIAHPKSGNTWLKAMISHLYHVRYQLPDSLLIKSDELARRHPGVPRLAATNGVYSYEGIIGQILDADAPDSPLRHKPILFIARNPIDIAVSWYYQFTKRQSKHKQELINHAIAHPIDRNSIPMWEFVRHSDVGLPFLIDFLNRWERNLAKAEHALTIRYEDLRAEPAATLKQVMEHMGESFSDAEIRQAVEFGSFDNMRQLESKGFFRQGGMSLRDKNDTTSFKTRRGKVKGYTDYFDPEQVEELEQLMYSRLSPTFGYGPQEEQAPPPTAAAAS